jgi:hypothetical protein
MTDNRRANKAVSEQDQLGAAVTNQPYNQVEQLRVQLEIEKEKSKELEHKLLGLYRELNQRRY